VRTWVKKDSYHRDVVRATNPCKAGDFGRPGWRVRITKPTLWTIDQTSHITASSTRSLEARATNSRLNERELAAPHRDEVHEHEQSSRFSRK